MLPEHMVQELRSYYPDADEFELRNIICNQGHVLPQAGLPQQVWHMPTAWMGIRTDPSMHYQEAAEAATKAFGWKPGIPYMLVLPSPDERDISTLQALSPESAGGDFLLRQLEDLKISLNDVMVSHAVRFKLPEGIKTYKAEHRKICADLLMADIAACRPKVIVAFGADALRAVFRDFKMKLDHVRGDVLYVELPDGDRIPVIPTVSHLSFLSSHANKTVFDSELRRAIEVKEGLYKKVVPLNDYRVCASVESVQKLVEDIYKSDSKRIAFDTEFGNDVARNEYRYTLSVQVAWGKGKAAFIKLRTQVPQDEYDIDVPYGKVLPDGTRKTKKKHVVPGPKCGVKFLSDADEAQIWKLLQGMFLDKRFVVAGHHIRVDAEQFARSDHPIDERIDDGFDTMLVHHLMSGDERQGLDHLVRKYVPTFGAYWGPLEQWLQANNGTARLQFGYRDIPLDILIPYGLADADATWQIAEILAEELKRYPKLEKLYWSLVAPTSLHLLDVERNGILVDDSVRAELRETYQPVYDELITRLRAELNWPTFSPTSRPEMQYLLFSDHDYKDREKMCGLIPEGVKLLHLKPLYNTDKYPKQWDDIVHSGKAGLNTPCTKSAVLDLLVGQYPDIEALKLLKHLSVVGKFLSTYLQPVTLNEFGVPEDGSGFHNNIRNDGRVTTRLSQLTETGRYTSSATNLQVSPKKQEASIFEAVVYSKFSISVKEYARRTDDGEPATGKPAYAGPDRIAPEERIVAKKFKRCLVAEEDHYLIEVDFKTAEVFSAAYQSGDKALIDVVDKGRDLHSETACRCFRLPQLAALNEAVAKLNEGDRVAYDQWAASFKKSNDLERTISKSLTFGILYGRGAASLSREISKNVGKLVTVDECQKIIDMFAETYPVLWAWLQKNMDSAVENEYVECISGRRRYFTGVSQMGQREQAAARREASNSPIQGSVADLLASAGVMLYRAKKDAFKHLRFKILLPIHDAFLIEVHKDDIKLVIQLVKACMSTWNKLPGTNYNLGVDIEVYKRWGDKPLKNY